MVVISLTRMKRGLGVFARVFALLFLAGIALPRALDILARYMAPAGAAGKLRILVEKVLSVLGVMR